MQQEQENSKTTLPSSAQSKSETTQNFGVFFNQTLRFTGHSCRGERFAAWNRSLTAGAQRGRLCSPRKQREKWMPESWLPTTMMLWSCGVNEGAPRKVIFWTKRYSDCTTSAKANWREPRCSTSILRQWPNSWKGRNTRPKTLFDHVTLSSSGGIPYAAFDSGSGYQQ